jgi:hypothetical protein
MCHLAATAAAPPGTHPLPPGPSSHRTFSRPPPRAQTEWVREVSRAIAEARADARTWSEAVRDWSNYGLSDEQMLQISEEFWWGTAGTRSTLIDLGSPDGRAADHAEAIEGLGGFVTASARLQDCITRPDPSQCELANQYVHEADERLARVQASL